MLAYLRTLRSLSRNASEQNSRRFAIAQTALLVTTCLFALQEAIDKHAGLRGRPLYCCFFDLRCWGIRHRSSAPALARLRSLGACVWPRVRKKKGRSEAQNPVIQIGSKVGTSIGPNLGHRVDEY